jgi:hypothetical protein
MKIPPEIKALIESGSVAHLVTLNPDGSPQVTLSGWESKAEDRGPGASSDRTADNQ